MLFSYSFDKLDKKKVLFLGACSLIWPINSFNFLRAGFIECLVNNETRFSEYLRIHLLELLSIVKSNPKDS